MKRMISLLTVFLLGGGIYAMLEVLWRGYTHPSMAVVGGAALCLVYIVEELPRGIFTKMLLCGLGITVLEWISGLVLNVVLKLNVWDYSELWGNFMGQICIWFTLLWMGLSLLGLYLCRILKRHIFR